MAKINHDGTEWLKLFNELINDQSLPEEIRTEISENLPTWNKETMTHSNPVVSYGRESVKTILNKIQSIQDTNASGIDIMSTVMKKVHSKNLYNDYMNSKDIFVNDFLKNATQSLEDEIDDYKAYSDLLTNEGKLIGQIKKKTQSIDSDLSWHLRKSKGTNDVTAYGVDTIGNVVKSRKFSLSDEQGAYRDKPKFISGHDYNKNGVEVGYYEPIEYSEMQSNGKLKMRKGIKKTSSYNSDGPYRIVRYGNETPIDASRKKYTKFFDTDFSPNNVNGGVTVIPKGRNKYFVSNAPKQSEGLEELKRDIDKSLITNSKANIEVLKGTGYKDIANVSNSFLKNRKGTKGLSFFDFEAIGQLGSKEYAPTQFSMRNGNTSVTKMLQLHEDAQEYIQKLMQKVQNSKGLEDGLTEDERRDLFQMADYSLDGNGNIQAFHKTLDKNTRIKSDTDLYKKITQGFDLLRGHTKSNNLIQNPGGSVGNLISSALDHGGYIVGHNIRNYDVEALKTYGINPDRIIDTLELAKRYYNYGDSSSVSGKRLMGYSQSALQDFFNISLDDVKDVNQHTAEYDTLLNRRIFEAILNDVNSGNVVDLYTQKAIIKPGQVGIAGTSYFRKNGKDFKADAKGNILKQSDNNWNDLLFRNGSQYRYEGVTIRDGENFAKFIDLDKGESIYTYIKDKVDLGKLLSNVYNGNFGDYSKDVVSAKASIFNDKTGYWNLTKMLEAQKGKDVGSFQQNRFNQIKADDNFLQALNSIYNELGKTNFSDEDKSLAVSELGRRLGIQQSSRFSANIVKTEIAKKSGGTVLGTKKALRNFLQENQQDFASMVKWNEIYKDLNSIQDMSDSDIGTLNDKFYGIYHRIADQIKNGKFARQYNSHLKTTIDNISDVNSVIQGVISDIGTQVQQSGQGAMEQLLNIGESDAKEAINGHMINKRFEQLKQYGVRLNKRNKPTTLSDKNGFVRGSIADKLSQSIDVLGKQGIGTNLQYTKDQQGIKVSLFDVSKRSDIMSFDENGNLIFDESQMASVVIPIDKGNGIINDNGMNKVNMMTTTYGSRGIDISTISDDIVSNLTSLFNSASFQYSIKQGDLGRVRSRMYYRKKDAMDLAPSGGTYKKYDDDYMGQFRPGGSPETIALRTSVVNMRNAIKEMLAKEYNITEGMELEGGKVLTDFDYNKKIQQMMDFGSLMGRIPDASFDDFFLENSSSSWIKNDVKDFSKIRKVFSDFYKKFPQNLNAIKEQNYLKQSFGLLGAEKFRIGGEFFPEDQRNLAQFFNGVGTEYGKESSKYLKNSVFLTDAMRSIGRNRADNTLEKTLSGLRISDSDIVEGYKDFYTEVLKQEGILENNPQFNKILTQLMSSTILPSVENDASVISQSMLDSLNTFNSKSYTLNKGDLDRVFYSRGIKNFDPNKSGTYDFHGNNRTINKDINIGSGVIKKGSVINSLTVTEDGNYIIDVNEEIRGGRAGHMKGIVGNSATRTSSTAIYDTQLLNNVARILGKTSIDELQYTSGSDNNMIMRYITKNALGVDSISDVSDVPSLFMSRNTNMKAKNIPNLFDNYEKVITDWMAKSPNTNKIENLFDVLSTNSSKLNDGDLDFLKKYFSVDKTNGTLSSNAFFSSLLGENGGWGVLQNGSVIPLFDDNGVTISDFLNLNGGQNGGLISRVANALDVNYNPDAFRALYHLADDANYFTGWGADVLGAQHGSRYKVGIRETQAADRKISSITTGDLYKDEDLYKFKNRLHDSMTANDKKFKELEEVSTRLDNIWGTAYKVNYKQNGKSFKEDALAGKNIIKIVDKKSSEDLADNEVSLFALGNKTSFSSDGITVDDYKNTTQGMIEEAAKRSGYNNGDYIVMYEGVPVNLRSKNGTIEGDTMIFGPHERNVLDNGNIEYSELDKSMDTAIRQLQQAKSPTYKGEDKEGYRASYQEYLDSVFDTIHDKESPLFQSLFSKRMPNAAAGKALGMNYTQFSKNINGEISYDDFANKFENSIIISTKQAKEMLSARGLQGTDYSNYVKNLKYTLANMSGAVEGDAEFNRIMSLKSIDPIIDEIIENATINGKSISDIKSLNGLFHRFPSPDGMDMYFGDTFIDSTMSEGSMYVPLGLGMGENLDYDGDVQYAALLGLTETFKDYQDFQKYNKGFQKVRDFDKRVTSKLRDKTLLEAGYVNGYKDQSEYSAKEAIFDMQNYKDMQIAALMAKSNFGKIGTFSNFATANRMAMTNAGIDENSENLVEKGRAVGVRSIFQLFEQDAISSKKVSDRMRKILSRKGIRDASSQNDIILDSLDEFANMLTDTSHYNMKSAQDRELRWNNIFKKAENLGILGENGVFDTRHAWKAVATIEELAREHMSSIIEDNGLAPNTSLQDVQKFFLEQIFGKNMVSSFEYDQAGNLVKGGDINTAGILKAVVEQEELLISKTGQNFATTLFSSDNAIGRSGQGTKDTAAQEAINNMLNSLGIIPSKTRSARAVDRRKTQIDNLTENIISDEINKNQGIASEISSVFSDILDSLLPGENVLDPETPYFNVQGALKKQGLRPFSNMVLASVKEATLNEKDHSYTENGSNKTSTLHMTASSAGKYLQMKPKPINKSDLTTLKDYTFEHFINGDSFIDEETGNAKYVEDLFNHLNGIEMVDNGNGGLSFASVSQLEQVTGHSFSTHAATQRRTIEGNVTHKIMELLENGNDDVQTVIESEEFKKYLSQDVGLKNLQQYRKANYDEWAWGADTEEQRDEFFKEKLINRSANMAQSYKTMIDTLYKGLSPDDIKFLSEKSYVAHYIDATGNNLGGGDGEFNVGLTIDKMFKNLILDWKTIGAGKPANLEKFLAQMRLGADSINWLLANDSNFQVNRQILDNIEEVMAMVVKTDGMSYMAKGTPFADNMERTDFFNRILLGQKFEDNNKKMEIQKEGYFLPHGASIKKFHGKNQADYEAIRLFLQNDENVKLSQEELEAYLKEMGFEGVDTTVKGNDDILKFKRGKKDDVNGAFQIAIKRNGASGQWDINEFETKESVSNLSLEDVITRDMDELNLAMDDVIKLKQEIADMRTNGIPKSTILQKETELSDALSRMQNANIRLKGLGTEFGENATNIINEQQTTDAFQHKMQEVASVNWDDKTKAASDQYRNYYREWLATQSAYKQMSSRYDYVQNPSLFENYRSLIKRLEESMQGIIDDPENGFTQNDVKISEILEHTENRESSEMRSEIDDQSLLSELKSEEVIENKINNLLSQRKELLASIVQERQLLATTGSEDQSELMRLQRALQPLEYGIKKNDGTVEGGLENLLQALEIVSNSKATDFRQKIKDQNKKHLEEIYSKTYSAESEGRKLGIKQYKDNYQRMLDIQREMDSLSKKPNSVEKYKRMKELQTELSDRANGNGYATYDTKRGTVTDQKGKKFRLNKDDIDSMEYYMQHEQDKNNEKMVQVQQAIDKKKLSLSGFFKKVGSQTIAYFGMSMSYALIGAVQKVVLSVIQQTKLLDQNMVNLQIVTGKNRSEAYELIKTYGNFAQTLGITTQDVMQSANTFLRMGYSLADTNELIKQSTILSKVGMVESAQAAEYLTSAIKGYKLEANEASKAIDMATTLDMSYAVDTGYIFEAMSRTANLARTNKVELSELQSMISVAGEVTQREASVIGEGFKTALSRYGNVKANVAAKTDMSLLSEQEEGVDLENVNDIEKVLTHYNISMRESDNKTWKSYTDVLKDINKEWATYSDYEKNAISTAMFGTRQREIGLTVLENYGRVLQANEKALNSSGSAQKKFDKYQNGLEASLNELTASWENLIISLKGNGAMMEVVTVLATVLKHLKEISIVIGSIMAVAKADKILSFMNIMGTKNYFGRQKVKGFFSGGSGNKILGGIGKAKDTWTKANEEAALMREEPSENQEPILSINDYVKKIYEKLSGKAEDDKESKIDAEKAEEEKVETAEEEKAAIEEHKNTVINDTESTATHATEVHQDAASEGADSVATEEHSAAVQVDTNITEQHQVTEREGSLVLKNIGNTIGMIAGPIGGSLIGKNAAKFLGKSEETATNWAMMGSMIGMGMSFIPGVGPILGIISALIGFTLNKVMNEREKTRKQAIEGQEKAVTRLNDANENNSLVEQYDVLVRGVNALTGQNVSLSTDDYEEFLEIGNKLGEIFPSLIVRTDSLGNSFLGLGTTIGGISGKFQELTNSLQDEVAYRTISLDVWNETINKKANDDLRQEYQEAEKTYFKTAGFTRKEEDSRSYVEEVENGTFPDYLNYLTDETLKTYRNIVELFHHIDELTEDDINSDKITLTEAKQWIRDTYTDYTGEKRRWEGYDTLVRNNEHAEQLLKINMINSVVPSLLQIYGKHLSDIVSNTMTTLLGNLSYEDVENRDLMIGLFTQGSTNGFYGLSAMEDLSDVDTYGDTVKDTSEKQMRVVEHLKEVNSEDGVYGENFLKLLGLQSGESDKVTDELILEKLHLTDYDYIMKHLGYELRMNGDTDLTNFLNTLTTSELFSLNNLSSVELSEISSLKDKNAILSALQEKIVQSQKTPFELFSIFMSKYNQSQDSKMSQSQMKAVLKDIKSGKIDVNDLDSSLKNIYQSLEMMSNSLRIDLEDMIDNIEAFKHLTEQGYSTRTLDELNNDIERYKTLQEEAAQGFFSAEGMQAFLKTDVFDLVLENLKQGREVNISDISRYLIEQSGNLGETSKGSIKTELQSNSAIWKLYKDRVVGLDDTFSVDGYNKIVAASRWFGENHDLTGYAEAIQLGDDGLITQESLDLFRSRYENETNQHFDSDENFYETISNEFGIDAEKGSKDRNTIIKILTGVAKSINAGGLESVIDEQATYLSNFIDAGAKKQNSIDKAWGLYDLSEQEYSLKQQIQESIDAENKAVRQRERYNRQERKLNKQEREIDKQERLNELDDFLERRNLLIEQYNNQISNLDWGLDILADYDYVGRYELTLQKMNAELEKNQELQRQFEEVRSFNPQSAEEAQKQAEKMKSLSDQIQESAKSYIELKKSLPLIAMEQLSKTLGDINEHLELQHKIVNNASDFALSSLNNGKNLNVNGVNFWGAFYQESEIDKYRRVQEEMLELQKKYQDEYLNAQKNYLDRLKEENAENIAEQREDLKEQREDLEEQRKDLEKSLENSRHAMETAQISYARQKQQLMLQHADWGLTLTSEEYDLLSKVLKDADWKGNLVRGSDGLYYYGDPNIDNNHSKNEIPARSDDRFLPLTNEDGAYIPNSSRMYRDEYRDSRYQASIDIPYEKVYNSKKSVFEKVQDTLEAWRQDISTENYSQTDWEKVQKTVLDLQKDVEEINDAAERTSLDITKKNLLQLKENYQGIITAYENEIFPPVKQYYDNQLLKNVNVLNDQAKIVYKSAMDDLNKAQHADNIKDMQKYLSSAMDWVELTNEQAAEAAIIAEKSGVDSVKGVANETKRLANNLSNHANSVERYIEERSKEIEVVRQEIENFKTEQEKKNKDNIFSKMVKDFVGLFVTPVEAASLYPETFEEYSSRLQTDKGTSTTNISDSDRNLLIDPFGFRDNSENISDNPFLKEIENLLDNISKSDTIQKSTNIQNKVDDIIDNFIDLLKKEWDKKVNSKDGVSEDILLSFVDLLGYTDKEKETLLEEFNNLGVEMAQSYLLGIQNALNGFGSGNLQSIVGMTDPAVNEWNKGLQLPSIKSQSKKKVDSTQDKSRNMLTQVFSQAIDVGELVKIMTSKLEEALNKVKEEWKILIQNGSSQLDAVLLDESEWSHTKNMSFSVKTLTGRIFEAIRRAVYAAIKQWNEQTRFEQQYRLMKPALLEYGRDGWGMDGLGQDILNKLATIYNEINKNSQLFKINAPTPDQTSWENFGTAIGGYIADGIQQGVLDANKAQIISNINLHGGPSTGNEVSETGSFLDNIKKGQSIYFSSPTRPAEGHVGVYDGKGGVYHFTGKVNHATLDKMEKDGYHYLGYGWNGGYALTPEQADKMMKIAEGGKKYNLSQGQCQKWVSHLHAEAAGLKNRISYNSPVDIMRDRPWAVNTEPLTFNGEKYGFDDTTKLSISNTNKNGVLSLIDYMFQDYTKSKLDTIDDFYSMSLGGNNKRDIYQFFKDNGWTNEAIAGLMANIQQESSFNPMETNGISWRNYEKRVQDLDNRIYTKEQFIHDKQAFGIAQWYDSGRKSRFYDYMIEAGLSFGNLLGQLNYLKKELKEYGLWELGESKNINYVMNRILKDFEKPGNYDWESNRRGRYAQNLYLEILSYSKGVAAHQGGKALLGDENFLKGKSTPSPETLIYPNGQVEIVGQDGPIIKDIPKGTQVLTTAKTKELFNNIPSYAGGSEIGETWNVKEKWNLRGANQTATEWRAKAGGKFYVLDFNPNGERMLGLYVGDVYSDKTGEEKSYTESNAIETWIKKDGLSYQSSFDDHTNEIFKINGYSNFVDNNDNNNDNDHNDSEQENKDNGIFYDSDTKKFSLTSNDNSNDNDHNDSEQENKDNGIFYDSDTKKFSLTSNDNSNWEFDFPLDDLSKYADFIKNIMMDAVTPELITFTNHINYVNDEIETILGPSIENTIDYMTRYGLKVQESIYLRSHEDDLYFAELDTYRQYRDRLVKDFNRLQSEGADQAVLKSVYEAIEKADELVNTTEKNIESYYSTIRELAMKSYEEQKRINDANQSVLEAQYNLGIIGEKTGDNFFNIIHENALTEIAELRKAREDITTTLIKEGRNTQLTEEQIAENIKNNKELQNIDQTLLQTYDTISKNAIDSYQYDIDRNNALNNSLSIRYERIAENSLSTLKELYFTNNNSILKTARDNIKRYDDLLNDNNILLSPEQIREYTDTRNQEAWKEIDAIWDGTEKMYSIISTQVSNANSILEAQEKLGITALKSKGKNHGFSPLHNNYWSDRVKNLKSQIDAAEQAYVDAQKTAGAEAIMAGYSAGSVGYDEYVKNHNKVNETLSTYLDLLKQVKSEYQQQLEYQIQQIEYEKTLIELRKSEKWSNFAAISNYYNSINSKIEDEIDKYRTFLTIDNLSEEEYNEYRQKIAELEKELFQNSLQKLQEQQNYRQEQYQATTSMVNEYIEALNEEKETISDMYDEEVRKLQNVNDEKERSIKLTELQNNLDNAQREKRRVYRAGVGFVYEQDREAIKKANDELDNFYREDRISSLNEAKEMETKILDDRVKAWNKYLSAIEKVYNTVERRKNMSLIEEWLGIDKWDGIWNKLDSDLNSFLVKLEGLEKIYHGGITPLLDDVIDIGATVNEREKQSPNILSDISKWYSSNSPSLSGSPTATSTATWQDFVFNVNEIKDNTVPNWKEFTRENGILDIQHTMDDIVEVQKLAEKYLELEYQKNPERALTTIIGWLKNMKTNKENELQDYGKTKEKEYFENVITGKLVDNEYTLSEIRDMMWITRDYYLKNPTNLSDDDLSYWKNLKNSDLSFDLEKTIEIFRNNNGSMSNLLKLLEYQNIDTDVIDNFKKEMMQELIDSKIDIAELSKLKEDLEKIGLGFEAIKQMLSQLPEEDTTVRINGKQYDRNLLEYIYHYSSDDLTLEDIRNLKVSQMQDKIKSFMLKNGIDEGETEFADELKWANVTRSERKEIENQRENIKLDLLKEYNNDYAAILNNMISNHLEDVNGISFESVNKWRKEKLLQMGYSEQSAEEEYIKYNNDYYNALNMPLVTVEETIKDHTENIDDNVSLLTQAITGYTSIGNGDGTAIALAGNISNAKVVTNGNGISSTNLPRVESTIANGTIVNNDNHVEYNLIQGVDNTIPNTNSARGQNSMNGRTA